MREKVILGDCFENLSKIEDNSIDLTITSPPYDDLRNYKGYIFTWRKSFLIKKH